MPELPEVETIRRQVADALVGRRLVDVETTLPKLLIASPLPDLGVLAGRTLIAARRRAKILILDFSDAYSLLVHFKLAGQFAILLPDGSRLVAGHPVPDPAGPYPHRTSHARFEFGENVVAWYSDVRQFGWLRLMETEDVGSALAAFRFGPEATDSTFDTRPLIAAMARRTIPIKTLLLDQTFIAGLGNIYVDEVLWRAHVHPGRAASSLGPVERKRVLSVVPSVVEAGIAQGGARIIHQRAVPRDGFPAVHGREGEPCVACGSTIVKTRVAGRGTYYCPQCQRLPRTRGPKPRPAATSA